MNNTISGIIATVVAAITSVHCELYRDCRAAVATVNTRHFGSAGDHQRPHEVVPLRNHRDQPQGDQDRTAGRQHDVHDHVEGVRPVQTRGIDQVIGNGAKCWRSKKIAYGEPKTNGNTNAQKVFRRPSCAIIRYSGTTVTVAGTIRVAT